MCVMRRGRSALALAESIHNDEIVRMLRDVIAFDKERHSLMFPKEIQQLVFYSCAHRYITYYIASQQDDLSGQMDHLRGKLRNQQKRIDDLKLDIHQHYDVGLSELDEIIEKAGDTISEELRNLVSNRNRRAQGVGTNEDLIMRCSAVASAWHAKTPSSAK